MPYTIFTGVIWYDERMARKQKTVIKNLIFDFDGTIADSLPAMISVYNKLIRNNENPLTEAEIERLRGMTSRRALKHMGVRWWQVPKLLLLGMGDFHDLVPTMKSFKGLPEVIKQLHARGDRLFMVTSNSQGNVMKFLELNGLDGYFIEIDTGSGLFSKAKHIRRLISKHGLKRKETVYVGDETRDIQAARLSLIRPVSVTWGLNTRKILKRQRPAVLIDEPEDLLRLGKI